MSKVEDFAGGGFVAIKPHHSKRHQLDPRIAEDLLLLGNVGRDRADGDVFVMVRTHSAFLFDNASADAVDQSLVGKKCYIHDSKTVCKTSATNTKSEGGVVLEITNEGVWVA